jgi:hypothetical protein
MWWESVNIPIKRIVPDSRGNGLGYNGELWDGVTIWQKPGYQQTIVWRVNYQPNESLFGDLPKRIQAALPWYDIQGLTLWSNKIAIPAHQDGLPRDPFPSAPRVMLFDDCTDRTFYTIHKDTRLKSFPDLTVGPNLFLFNNENCFHGATQPTGSRKILMRIDGPLIDPEGLQQYLVSQIEQGAKFE